MPMDKYGVQCWNIIIDNTPKLTNIAGLKDCFVNDTEWFAASVSFHNGLRLCVAAVVIINTLFIY